MQIQKYNPKTVIYSYDFHSDQNKSMIEQIYAYIDSLNLESRSAIFNIVEVHGGTFMVIGFVHSSGLWASFIAFSYSGGQIYHLWRGKAGEWNYESLI